MKTIAALQAWNNFSEYYSAQVGELIKDKYDLTVTYNNDPEYLNKFDIVWSFFPQFPKVGEFKNLVKTYWELHELGLGEKGKANVACSEYTYEILKRYNFNPLFRASLGVNKNHFFPQPFPEGKIRVGWCGVANNNKKRFKELEELMKTIPEVDFITSKIFNSNYPTNLKYKTIPDMNDFYKDIHIYVCSSAGEGFGLPLLEASACGRPVITFNVGIAPELQRDGAGLVIVSDFDTMKKEILILANNLDRIKEFGEMSSRTILEKWQWSNFRDQWLKVFDTALL